jgi:hypothetical protein
MRRAAQWEERIEEGTVRTAGYGLRADSTGIDALLD